MTDFVSLHNQTDFSILDSLMSPKALFNRAKELGQSAIAVTDHGTLAGAWDSLKASRETGVKLIMGCEIYFVEDAQNITDKFRHLTLLAKNANGYKNLLTLNKKGFDQGSFIGKRVYPIVDWKLLEQCYDGLICLTGCGNGIISQLLMNKKFDEVETTILKLKQLFGDNLGIEILPNNMKRGSNIYNDEIDQQFLNMKLINLGKAHNIKIVPTCNAHYVKKEDHDIHDVFLAIGSHQPKYSNFRIKYNVPDFYLKSAEEVKNFFARNHGEELAEEWCNNTVYFANLCETPDWIDPKYSNPSGKELPIFPVKDETDYPEFVHWLELQPPEIKLLDIDKQYLRFKCQAAFSSRIKDLSSDNMENYQQRLLEELDVIEYHGFSSYMLIVADYINWARRNDIAVGEGRGCLTGDTQVLTTQGFKLIKDLSVTDTVFSHTGNMKTISKLFKFDVSNEKLLKFKTQQSFTDLTMTSDHKVLIAKSQDLDKYYFYPPKKVKGKIKNFNPHLEWVPAQQIKVGDYFFTPKLNRTIKNLSDIDLAQYSDSIIENDFIVSKIYFTSPLSLRALHKASPISFESLRKIKNNKPIADKQINLFQQYLSSTGSSLQDFVNHKNYKYSRIQRFIKIDNDFAYLLGRWIGDGSFHGNKGISICFNNKDIVGREKIKSYLTKLGFHVCQENRKNNNTLLTVSNKAMYSLFKELFPNYHNSQTKHMPNIFRSFSDELIRHLLLGLVESDGCINNNYEKIKTTSQTLALQVKEALNYLSLPSSIYTEENPKRYKVTTSTAFTIAFNGIKTKPNPHIHRTNQGFYSKVVSIVETTADFVYDFTVPDDHSYLTTSGVVHNSVGGSLIAFLLGIHQADPIKYDLIFARFHNKEKSSFPDIDTDFAPSGREKVQSYVRQKYGEDHVAHVSNVNTITPKVYVRDIARACELGGSREEAVRIGNDVADCIPSDIHSIDDALSKVPLFAEYCKKYPELEKYKSICGKYRAWSTHAGGIIISARPLTGLIPLRRDKDGALAIEYDKDKAEENGLVKMDTLGLSTLDIIGETYRIIKERGKEVPPDQLDYDVHDAPSYDLIANGDTFCVFQLGTSAGTVDLCRRIKPDSINDLANINALARPSAREMRNDFIKVKNGGKQITLLHSKLARAFNSTYGFGLYEECLMYLAQDIAGWSLHSADRLRKLTKEKGKNPKKVQQWKTEFIADAVKMGVQELIAQRIWSEIIEPFQGYGFNKSLSLFEMIDIYNSNGTFLYSKPIGEVKPGEYVRSRDESTQKEIFVEVKANHDHGILPLVEVELETGETVKCTMDHKFRVQENKEMVPLWQILRDNLSIVLG